MSRPHRHKWTFAGIEASATVRGAWSVRATWGCASCRAERYAAPLRLRKPAPTASAGVVTSVERRRPPGPPGVAVEDLAALGALGYKVSEATELLTGVSGDTIEERVLATPRRIGGDSE